MDKNTGIEIYDNADNKRRFVVEIDNDNKQVIELMKSFVKELNSHFEELKSNDEEITAKVSTGFEDVNGRIDTVEDVMRNDHISIDQSDFLNGCIKERAESYVEWKLNMFGNQLIIDENGNLSERKKGDLISFARKEIHRDLKKFLGMPLKGKSFRKINRNSYQLALDFVRTWKPEEK